MCQSLIGVLLIFFVKMTCGWYILKHVSSLRLYLNNYRTQIIQVPALVEQIACVRIILSRDILIYFCRQLFWDWTKIISQSSYSNSLNIYCILVVLINAIKYGIWNSNSTITKMMLKGKRIHTKAWNILPEWTPKNQCGCSWTSLYLSDSSN